MSRPVYKAFTEKSFDGSHFQDSNGNPYFPILTRLKEHGFSGGEIRIKAGILMDEDFRRYLAEAIKAYFETINVYTGSRDVGLGAASD